MSKDNLKLSIVVCSYNRGKKIRNCIDALLAQSLPRNQYEIIVVNDGSTDDTATIINEYKDSIRIITNNPNQGLGQSRNNGARAARALIIAFTDDDCIADNDWAKRLLSAYDDPSVMAAGGKIIPYKNDKWLLKYYEANNPLAHVTFTFDSNSGMLYTLTEYIKRSFSLKRLPDAPIKLQMIVGANMSMRRDIFDKVAGFDPKLRFGGEEEDFWTRLRAMDPTVTMRYVPTAVIGHDYDASFKDAIRRNYKYGMGAARLYLKDRSRLPVLYPFPLAVVGSLAFVVFSPYFLLFSVALLFGLYGGWIRAAVIARRPLFVYFACVQFALELFNDLGFIRGALKAAIGGKS